MSVKVLISRRIAKSLEDVVRPYLMELHSLSLKQTGYISGETFINNDNSEDYLVISSWQSLTDWQNYMSLDEAIDLHAKVNDTLGKKTVFRIYVAK